MLDDRDRARLSEIQRQFAAEDARFVQAFETRARDLPARPPGGDRRRRHHTVLMWLAGSLGMLMLMLGVVGGALLFAAVVAALVMARPARTGSRGG